MYFDIENAQVFLLDEATMRFEPVNEEMSPSEVRELAGSAI
jgi:hypothetical protein